MPEKKVDWDVKNQHKQTIYDSVIIIPQFHTPFSSGLALF